MRKYFNMIEITLAIAIVALGMAGILALFPVGFQSARDSMGDNYINYSSQFFLSYIKLLTKKDTTYPVVQVQGDIDSQWTATMGAIPTSKPDSSASVDTVNPSHSGWDATPEVPNLYYKSGTPGLYRIYSGTNDFNAAMRIWKTPTVSPVYISGAWTYYSSTDFSKSCGLNIEFSWPIEKPYAQRIKRFFYYEIFKTLL